MTAPELPRSATDPLAVVIVGTALFAVALVVTALGRTTFGNAWQICAAGVAVGLIGALVFSSQARAARRGDRGAQRGLL